MLTIRDKREFLKSAVLISQGAGAIIKKGFRLNKQINFKSRIDPVTEYDLKSEKFIVREISKLYKDHDILAEEGGEAGLGSDYKWVIDPLDGTVNYSHGFPVYCVSIALEYKGEIIVGAVFDPERDELFSAIIGEPSRLNGKKIVVSKESKLHRSMLATGFAYDVQTAKKNNLGYFSRMIKKAQAVRRAGSAALDLCYVAAGRFDGFWELSLQPWDSAAGKIIIESAGGKITAIDGSKFSIYGKGTLASNGRIHTQIRQALRGL